MNISKSIDFLPDRAGPVIQYRLRKEILKDLSRTEEENLLEKVYQTPWFQLLESYVKPDGYIGRGMHSRDNCVAQSCMTRHCRTERPLRGCWHIMRSPQSIRL